MTSEAVKVLVAYSDKDSLLKDELISHLAILRHRGIISAWHDLKSVPGGEANSSNSNIHSAQVILVLLSADFIASDYCWSLELKQAMQCHDLGEICVIPVILRPVNLEETPFKHLQLLPEEGKPITQWYNRDEALVNVLEGIEMRIKQFLHLETKNENTRIDVEQSRTNLNLALKQVQQGVVSPINVFISSSHKDEDLKHNLTMHLGFLERQGLINLLNESNYAGRDWTEVLHAAQVVLVLISPDFIDSDYCWNHELPLAMQLHQVGAVSIIPIILRPCYWCSPLFDQLRVLPEDKKPITTWQDIDEAFVNVARGIFAHIKQLNTEKLESNSRSRVGDDQASKNQKLNNQMTFSTIREPQIDGGIEVFLSYSHRDESFREKLESHVALLKRQGIISLWNEREIRAGIEWETDEVDSHINSAQIILLFVSADFLASDYCWGVEIERAIYRSKAGEARIIPIIIRPCDWRGSTFDHLQALPKNARPITSWSNQDEAFLDVTEGIIEVIKYFITPEASIKDNSSDNAEVTNPTLAMLESQIDLDMETREALEWLETNLTAKKVGRAALERLPELEVALNNAKETELFYHEIEKYLERIRYSLTTKQYSLLREPVVVSSPSIKSEAYIAAFDFLKDSIPERISITVKEELEARINYLSNYIREYFQKIEIEEVDQLFEAKLLILGEGGAGKTTLSKKIRNPDYQIFKDEESTEGIEVTHWQFPLENGHTFRVNIWDFGGQEIYHTTHQFFLTHRSLYLLVADTRKEDTDFFYWLNVVELLSNNSPLLIIKNERQDRYCEIDENTLRGRFPNLEKVLATDLATNRGLGNILSEIKHQIAHLPHVGNSLLKSWVTVRKTLETDSRNYIGLDEYLMLCRENGFKNREDALNLSSYLHDLGVCLHFQDDFLLKKTIILKPKWATDAVYKVLDNRAIIYKLGRFNSNDLQAIWCEPIYADMQDELLQLMMRFRLCYAIPNTGDYIAPQLLTPKKPDYSWEASQNLILRYTYEFMPKGIITQFIVLMHSLIEQQQYVWRSGIVLEHDNTRAEVIENYDRREIRVRVVGKYKKKMMDILTYELEKIHAIYQNLKYQKFIPCNCSVCRNQQNPHFYPLETLLRFVDNQWFEIQCQTNNRMVNVVSLIDDVMDRARLFGDSRGLNDIMSTEVNSSKEVFISYAWRGESEKIADRIDKVFQDKGITIVRDKRDLEFKGSITEFMRKIGRGRCVIVVISEKYLKSENCMFELVEISSRGEFRDRIFPIVLDDAKIYKPIERIRYLQYWDEEKRALDEAMRSIGSEYQQGFRESIDLYTKIRNTIADLTNTIKDMNTLTVDIHSQSDFDEIFKAVECKLSA